MAAIRCFPLALLLLHHALSSPLKDRVWPAIKSVLEGNQSILKDDKTAHTEIFILRQQNNAEETFARAKSLFSTTLDDMRMKGVGDKLKTTWTLIYDKPNTANTTLECLTEVQPQHIMASIVLESLFDNLSRKMLKDIFLDEFCRGQRVTLTYVESNDVISGVVLTTTYKDGNAIATLHVTY